MQTVAKQNSHTLLCRLTVCGAFLPLLNQLSCIIDHPSMPSPPAAIVNFRGSKEYVCPSDTIRLEWEYSAVTTPRRVVFETYREDVLRGSVVIDVPDTPNPTPMLRDEPVPSTTTFKVYPQNNPAAAALFIVRTPTSEPGLNPLPLATEGEATMRFPDLIAVAAVNVTRFPAEKYAEGLRVQGLINRSGMPNVQIMHGPEPFNAGLGSVRFPVLPSVPLRGEWTLRSYMPAVPTEIPVIRVDADLTCSP